MMKALSWCAGAAAVAALAAPAAAQQRQPFGPGATPRVRVAAAAAQGRVVGQDRRRPPGSGFGRGRFGRGGLVYGLGAFGGGLTDDPERHRDDGFFAGTGDSARVNGAAVYDYDRAYPYDWYRGDDMAADEGERRRPAAETRVRCEVTRVSGSAVKVCRGRR